MAVKEPKQKTGIPRLYAGVCLRTVDPIGDGDNEDALELFRDYSVGPFTFRTAGGKEFSLDFVDEDHSPDLLDDGRVQVYSRLHTLELSPYGEGNAAAGIKPEDLTPDFITSCSIEKIYYEAWFDAMENEHIPMDVIELSFGIEDGDPDTEREFTKEAIADYNKNRAIHLPVSESAPDERQSDEIICLLDLIARKDRALREALFALDCARFLEKDETNYGRAATAHFVVAEALALTQQTLTRDSMRRFEDDARVGALLRQCASGFPNWSAADLLDSFLGAESNLDHAAEQRAVMAAAYLLAQEQFRER